MPEGQKSVELSGIDFQVYFRLMPYVSMVFQV